MPSKLRSINYYSDIMQGPDSSAIKNLYYFIQKHYLVLLSLLLLGSFYQRMITLLLFITKFNNLYMENYEC